MEFLTKTKLRIIITCGVALIIIAGGTVVLMRSINPPETPLQPVETSSKKATALVDSAARHEASGETQAAINDYQDALTLYQESNDAAGVESVTMQIAYLEKIREEEKKRAAGELPVELDERLPFERDETPSAEMSELTEQERIDRIKLKDSKRQ